MQLYLVNALDNLIEMLLNAAPASIGPPSPPSSYLPSTTTLQLRFADLIVRRQVVESYLNEVSDNWNKVDALGFIQKLNVVRAVHNDMKVRSDTPKPTAGLPNNDVKFFYEYLALDNAGLDTATTLGRDLVLQIKTVDQVITSAESAVDAIMNLRRLNDVLIRVLSAIDAASITASSVQEVLALYRVEGDMNVPPSDDSITQGIPPAITDARSMLNLPRPDISCLVILMANPPRSVSDEELKEYALILWFFQIAGMDDIGGLTPPFRASFASFSSSNWRLAGVTTGGTVAAGENRWDVLFNNMVLYRLGTGVSAAIMVTIKNPRSFIAGILQEAIIIQRMRGRIDSLLKGVLPPAMAGGSLSFNMSYLHYNAGTEKLMSILLRALVAATDKTEAGGDSKYTMLRQAIASDSAFSNYVAKLKPLKWLRDKAAADFVKKEWPKTEEWLKQNNNLELLSDFVESASGTVWSTWSENRGNLSRYRLLLDYYTRVCS